MALVPNLIKIPCVDALDQPAVTINSVIFHKIYVPDVSAIPFLDAFGGSVILINAGLYARHYLPQPFLSAGIQNPMVWGTFNFGPGYVNHPYSEQWFIENVTQPVVFTLSAGSLPPGLILSTIGNTAMGQIAGTPTTEGTYNFTLTATGPDLTAPKNFSILITKDVELPPITPQGTASVGGN